MPRCGPHNSGTRPLAIELVDRMILSHTVGKRNSNRCDGLSRRPGWRLWSRARANQRRFVGKAWTGSNNTWPATEKAPTSIE
ncbi:MAG: hypothetical protein Ct9H300mP1_23070 [Planctomycetaceae bacterium]|nr:MAG: hypothetical protein Ct9H300mP1_23070 [Planctomycetaceae bacterium]